MQNDKTIDTAWFEDRLLERLIRYARIETTSDRHISDIPSTRCQWDLINLLQEELKSIGVKEIDTDEHGYIIARIPSNLPGESGVPAIGFMAHVDTASEASGKDVKPRVHKNYQGGPIFLEDGITVDPKDFPELAEYTGETIITADGTTLLGADDKAGLAEIMTAAEWLISHPGIPHGEIEIIFTPDEETGKGMDLFPVEKLRSVYCYTMDGDGNGNIEAECFYGYFATVTCSGVSIHPGTARGKLMNAVTMAGNLLTMLPRNESPEATDGRYGFFCPLGIKGSIAESEVEILIRDFDYAEIERRAEMLRRIAAAVEAAFPGSKIKVDIRKQYVNMREYIEKNPKGLSFLKQAVEMAGTRPKEKIIRGGTDGARLAEKGIPTPNVFTGGAAYHGKKEWIVLSLMVKAAETILNVAELWAEEGAEI